VGPEEALGALGARPDGLSSAEAEARLTRQGPNVLAKPRGPGLVRQLFDQMFHFFALMLWVAAGLAFLGQMPQLGWAIMIVVVLNGLFSYAQEYRAERAIRALSALLPESALVLRGGAKVRIPAAELVAGDVMLLREGDRISADGRVIQSAGLKIDISMLTGESKPVSRMADPLADPPADIAEASNVVLAGTFVTSGSATVVVVATGSQTRLAAIAHLAGGIPRRPTPLRFQMNRVVRVIATCAVATGIVFFGISVALGMPAHKGFLFGIGVIVAVVPCGMLPTLAL
jgi:Ca2+-transporting ATPase